MASEDLEFQAEADAAIAALPTAESQTPLARHANDWRVLLVFFVLAGIVESQAFGHLGAFTPLFLQQLNVAPADIPTWTGLLSALGFVIGLPLLPFWGVWADRYSRKLIIVRSAYVEGVLFTVAALSPNVWVLAGARFLSGFVLGNTGVMLALLADVTPRKRLGFAVGLASAGFPIGASVGPLAGGLIVQHAGVRSLLGLDAAASALMGLLLTLVIREEHRLRAAQRAVGALLRTAASDIIRTPVVVRLFVLYFLAMFGASLAQPFVPIVLQGLYTSGNNGPISLLPTVLGATLTGAGIAMAITTPIWGRLGDSIGRWRILPICIGAVALALAGEALAPALLPFQVAIVGAGFFQGGIATTILALLATLTPQERRATVLNFSLLPSQLSWFLGPIVGAALAGVNLRLPFAEGAEFAFAALLVAFALSRTNPRETPVTSR
jgi:DHA1 family multidrug resistance protein-like MFS transporter